MSAEAIQSVRDAFTAKMVEIKELHGKGALGQQDAIRLGTLTQEATALRSQVEAFVAAGELDEWAARSTGMLPLAKDSGVHTFNEAGATTIEHDGKGAYRIGESFGVGIYDPTVSASIATPEYAEGFRDYFRAAFRPNQPPTRAMRALADATDTGGGYLVPAEILNKIIAKEPTPTRVQAKVSQFNTSRDNLVIPKVNYTTDDLYTTGMRVTFAGETPAASTTARVTDPIFGQERVQIYTATMSILVTRDIIEDAAFDLMGWLAGKFGETAELLKDNMILNGTGVGQPAGILANPGATANPAVTNSGSAATLGTDGATGTIQKLFNKVAFSLPEQYEDNLTWIMNKNSTAQAISQAIDGNGRLLWGSGLQDSGLAAGYQNRMLVGYPVTYSGFMPNVGANNFPIIFGDPRGYYLVNRVGFSVEVFRELYAETNQVLVLGRLRFGGKVAEDWRLKIVKCST
jgi:HK97 family phage major capsid protein